MDDLGRRSNFSWTKAAVAGFLAAGLAVGTQMDCDSETGQALNDDTPAQLRGGPMDTTPPPVTNQRGLSHEDVRQVFVEEPESPKAPKDSRPSHPSSHSPAGPAGAIKN